MVVLQEGSSPEANRLMAMANECIDQLRAIAMELQSMGQPNENVRMR